MACLRRFWYKHIQQPRRMFTRFRILPSPNARWLRPTHGFAALVLLIGAMMSVSAGAQTAAGLPDEADELHTAAGRAFAEESWSLAAEAYARLLDEPGLDTPHRQYLRYRLHTARWRDAAASRSARNEDQYRAALTALEELAGELRPDGEERPPVLWARVQASLALAVIASDDYGQRQQAAQHLGPALGFWASSTDLDTAREEYLDLVLEVAGTPNISYHQRQQLLPPDALRNALRLARANGHPRRGYLAFLLAETLQYSGASAAFRAAGLYEEALAHTPREDGWRDDILYQYALFEQQRGHTGYDADGNLRVEPDYEAALALFRRLVDDYDEDESRFVDQARDSIESITRREVRVLLSEQFRPGQPVSVDLLWRNADTVELAAYPVDLAQALRETRDQEQGEWLDKVDLGGSQPAASLTQSAAQERPYVQHRREIVLEDGLAAGAYIIEARAGATKSRALLLVTGIAVITKTGVDGQLLAWVTRADTGEPVAVAEITATARFRKPRNSPEPSPEILTTTTGDDGTALLSLPHGLGRPADLRLSARAGERVTFVEQNWFTYSGGDAGGRDWRIYAFTDRPAYRPGDTVRWKAIARIQSPGTAYTTPAGETLGYTLTGPRGDKLAEGKAKLNAFGALWAELELPGDAPLGLYRVRFTVPGQTGKARQEPFRSSPNLFRVEEYKLPEYQVAIETGGEDGRATAFRLCDPVEITVKADYYFGGGVPGAEVELIARSRPFYPSWRPRPAYPWLEPAARSTRPGFRGQGQEVFRETRKTGEDGTASFTIETPADASQDFEYTLTARVVDASWREVSARESIRITRQPYFAYIVPERTIWRPGELAEATLRTLDANEQPVAAKGRVTVTRKAWREYWVSPMGRRLSAAEMEELRKQAGGLFRRRPDIDLDAYVKTGGYEEERVADTRLETGADGEATFSFRPERDGWYELRFVSFDQYGFPVKGTNNLWVADDATTDTGYRGELDLIVGSDTLDEGGSADVLVSAPVSGRWVLLTAEGETLLRHQVVKLDGRSKLLRWDVTENWIPKAWLAAAAAYDYRWHSDTETVMVPPRKHFLEVSVEPGAGAYLPGGKASFAIEVSDHTGAPVAAELAFSTYDQALTYIQDDLAGDPREFFYPGERQRLVQTATSFKRRYAPLTQPAPEYGRHSSVAADEAAGLRSKGLARSTADRFAPQSGAELQERAAFAEDARRGVGGEEAPEVTVRSDFRDAAFWQLDIATGPDGRAEVSFVLPESTTTWEGVVRATTQGSAFGMGSAATRTRLPLIARLQLPRFLVAGDRAVLTGVFNNTRAAAMEGVRATLQAHGIRIPDTVETPAAPDPMPNAREAERDIPAGGSARVNWVAEATGPGEATLTLRGVGREHGDAMEKRLPVIEHGIEKFESLSGLADSGEITLSLDLPAHKPASLDARLHITPSIAAAALDALPYLVDYPYGCTEQTLSRFVPSVIVAKTLAGLGVPREETARRLYGRTQEGNPEHGLAELDAAVSAGLERLYDMQLPGGAWGWWKGGEPDLFMTGYAVWGLTLAEQAGVAVRASVLERARTYLDENLIEGEHEPDLQAWLLHAASSRYASVDNPLPTRAEAQAFANLWQQRSGLNAYTRALLALSAHRMGLSQDARTLARNLRNGLVRDEDPEQSILIGDAQGNANPPVIPTAHWGRDGLVWRWSETATEATAFGLMALLAIEPESELITPVMNWLVKNRRGAQWRNTRDTAMAVLALTDYLGHTGELGESVGYSVSVNGGPAAEGSADAAGTGIHSFGTEVLNEGENTVTIRRTRGDGPLFFSLRADYFTLEEPISPAGSEVFVHRRYARIEPVATLLQGFREETVPLGEDAELASGEGVQARLILEAKNDAEYLIVEDYKPAGLEAAAVRSGAHATAREIRPAAAAALLAGEEKTLEPDERYTGRTVKVYQELRDTRVVSFLRRLPEGYWEIEYRLRAEVPGRYHGLPAVAHAMYVPEMRANSAEQRISIRGGDPRTQGF